MIAPCAWGLSSDRFQVWFTPGPGIPLSEPRTVCMYVLETSEGPAVSGWVCLGRLKELNSRKKKNKPTQLVEHVCQIK